MGIWDRIMGRSVKDLAQEVDDAKALLDTAEGRLAEQLGRVAQEEQNVALARQDYEAACAALVKEHPHLVGNDKKESPVKQRPVITNHHDGDPGAWSEEVVEVDDENDPRFVGDVPLVSTSDDEPIGPIDFDVREGEED